jgi:hypothetical protein
MSSEARTLVVILLVLGVLGCGCIVAPLSVVGLLTHRYQAEQKRAEKEALDKAFSIPRPVDPLPPAEQQDSPATSIETSPPPESRIPPVTPPLEPPPAAGDPRNPAPPAAASGGLSESQKRFIYRSARIHRQIVEQMEQQLADQRGRGINTSVLEKIIADTRARQEQSLDDLCRQRGITRAELDVILAEGDKDGW